MSTVTPTASAPEPAVAAPALTGAELRYLFAKRVLDLSLGAVLLLLAAPVMAIVALAILLDTGRPVLYRQERMSGRPRRRQDGTVIWEERPFRIVKFRTMVVDADANPVHERYIEAFVRGVPDSGAKLAQDPRVTRVGRWLRASSLDELPQLFNVLAATMSLVGPRPVPTYEIALYGPHHRERLRATPGITGSWQVQGRGRVGFEEMVALDIDYVRRRSLRLDLALLMRTLPAVLSAKGAR